MTARRLTALCIASSMMATSLAHAQNGSLSRSLYDLRDLDALLPARAAQPQIVHELISQSPFVVERPVEPDPRTVEQLVAGICDSLEMKSKEVFPGVYVVEGQAVDQQQFAILIDQVRALFDQRLNLQVICYRTTDEPPAVGHVAEPPSTALRLSTTVVAGVPVDLASTRTVDYFADLQPVVGDGSVGYDVMPEAQIDGLALSLTVKADEDQVAVSLVGVLRDTAIEQVTFSLGNLNIVNEIQLGAPVEQTRAFRASASLSPGNLTVTNVFPGFEEGESVVIAVAARPE